MFGFLPPVNKGCSYLLQKGAVVDQKYRTLVGHVVFKETTPEVIASKEVRIAIFFTFLALVIHHTLFICEN